MKNNNAQIPTNLLLFLLFLLIIGDYLLTYIGVYTLNVIEEANPLMSNFMSLPFCAGIIIKILITLSPILLLKLAEPNVPAMQFRKIVLFPIALQLIPYTAHAIWIYKYFTILLLIGQLFK